MFQFDDGPCPFHRPSTPPQPFRFLDLPGELRNRIASYFIVSQSPICIHEPRFNRHASPPPETRSHPRFDRPIPPTPPMSRSPSVDGREKAVGHTRLAIMLACRELYQDYWKIYYSANTFSFNFDTFVRFTKGVPSRCRDEIKRIEFHMPHKHNHDKIWAMLAKMKSLEELEIWLRSTDLAAEAEWACAIEGAKKCDRLRAFVLRRGASEDSSQDEHVLERDRQVEGNINSYLRDREDNERGVGPFRSKTKHKGKKAIKDSDAEPLEE